jgi:hypothetical protein
MKFLNQKLGKRTSRRQEISRLKLQKFPGGKGATSSRTPKAWPLTPFSNQRHDPKRSVSCGGLEQKDR